MQTVLITGGAGFIGSALCEKLLELSYSVICVDNLSTSAETNINHLKDNPNFSFIKHDVILPMPENLRADAVYHLASPASPNHHSNISYHALPMKTMLVNTQGTINTAEFALKCQAKFLFASSSEVYGDPLEHPQKEEYRGNVSTIGPRSVYDEAKRFGETITAYFWRSKNLDARIARIFNTYGPKMNKADMRMIMVFISQAIAGKPITIFGDGKQTRSLCFVADTVEGLISLMFAPNTKREVVNLGSTDEHSVLDYANIVKRITNSNSEIVFSEDLPVDDPIKRKPSLEKVRRILSWEPKVGLEEGLKKTIEYIKKI